MSVLERALGGPEIEVTPKATRLQFTLEYKRKIVREADRAGGAGRGAGGGANKLGGVARPVGGDCAVMITLVEERCERVGTAPLFGALGLAGHVLPAAAGEPGSTPVIPLRMKKTSTSRNPRSTNGSPT